MESLVAFGLYVGGFVLPITLGAIAAIALVVCAVSACCVRWRRCCCHACCAQCDAVYCHAPTSEDAPPPPPAACCSRAASRRVAQAPQGRAIALASPRGLSPTPAPLSPAETGPRSYAVVGMSPRAFYGDA